MGSKCIYTLSILLMVLINFQVINSQTLCIDKSPLCGLRIANPKFCTDDPQADLCKASCNRCATTTLGPTTTSTVELTTTEPTTSTSTTRTTTTTTPTPTTPTITTPSTSTTSPTTTQTVKASTQSSASTTKTTASTRKSTGQHRAVKLESLKANIDYNMEITVVFLGHFNSTENLKSLREATASGLEKSSVKIARLSEIESSLGTATNNSGIRLTSVSWNVKADVTSPVSQLINQLEKSGTLGDRIDGALYALLPEAQVYNRDDFHPLDDISGPKKQEDTKTGKTADQWKVIVGCVGAVVGLIVLIIITALCQRRHGKKESMNLGDEADYSVEYTANDLYGTASPKTRL